MKGLFPSGIHWNFVGENVTEARRNFQIPDINMFFTSFILENLLESQSLGVISIPKSIIENTLEALVQFRDENAGEGVPVYNFWVKKFDTKNGGYYTEINNLKNVYRHFGGFTKYISENKETFIEMNIYDQIIELGRSIDLVLKTSSIRDADDTSTCFAIGYYLNQKKFPYPQIVEKWNHQNLKKWDAINMILTYTYKPFSNSFESKIIDQTTYFSIHPFLEEWKSKFSYENLEQLQSLNLISSWLYNISSETTTYPYLAMPTITNNVDYDIVANVLLGILKVLRTDERNGPVVLTQEIRNLFFSSSKLIEWSIKSRIVYERPDVTLFYYVTVHPYNHFVTRLIYFLEEFKFEENFLKGHQFPTILDSTLETLKKVAEVEITREILNMVQYNGEDIYWESFLGNADTVNGSRVKYGEDRFFSTALAINSLIDTWTVPFGLGNKRIWKPNTAFQVRSIVKSSIEYLNRNILIDPVRTSGPFFNFFPNTPENDPFRYPSNFCVYINGTKCDPHLPPTEPLLSGMIGVVSEQEYKKLLTESWSYSKTPLEFKGYNNFSMTYFSSDIYTYSISLLAFSKYLVIV
eukprot:gene6799-8436_t